MKLSDSSVSTVVYIGLVLVACIFAMISLFLPPVGVIDKTVLMYTAQLMILAVVTGLGLELRGSLTKGEISISKDVDRYSHEEESDEPGRKGISD